MTKLKYCFASVLFLFAAFATAQEDAPKEREGGHTNQSKFKQLYEEFSTPNTYRSASGAPGPDYYQQQANYVMNIELDDKNHRIDGTETITYTNNSPDQLEQVFYHLYFNAFQPGSMMDIRSRNIKDPDRRVGDRISKLSDEEIGYQKIKSLKQNGKKVDFVVEGTILEVQLNKPIATGETITLEMEFEAQVPLQIRRTGRDNAEGIRYSMAQWYPKLSEYDYQGWHANPYIGREFYGVWGNFDVKIAIDKEYLIGGTGYLQNPLEIGHGYEDAGQTVKQKVKKGKLTWHFKAPNVHDFMWAADPEYLHDKIKMANGTTLHFFHQEGQNVENWSKLPAITERAMEYANKNFGQYPYEQFAFFNRALGPYWWSYWMLILCNGLSIQLLWIKRFRESAFWQQYR